MIAPLSAEILALSTADRARLAARLIEVDELPDIVLRLLDGIMLDVMTRELQRLATGMEATH